MLSLFIPSFFMLLLPSLTKSKYSWSFSITALTLMSLLSLSKMPLMFPTLTIPSSMFDQMSVILISLSFFISSLMILASQKTFNLAKNFSLLMMMIIILNLILITAFSSTNLITFYIMFEASLIPTLLLILGWGYQPERLQASNYFILYTVTASLPLLLSIMLMLSYNGHSSMILPFWSSPFPPSLHYIWWLITITAFLVKTPMFMTHLWLPKAHVEAPVSGSMILAGVLLKLGGYGLIRLTSAFMNLSIKLTPLILSISLIGAVITSLICIRQTDMKSLIAYSSVSHMGLVTAGIFSNTPWGWTGALTLMIAHGLCSSSLFALANMTYETTQSRSIFITKGLMTLFPSMTLWWFIMSACNMASPPSINLAGEIFLISSILATSNISFIIVAIISFLSAVYSLILYTSSQHGTAPTLFSPLLLLKPQNFSICLLHFAPLIFLIMKTDLLSL